METMDRPTDYEPCATCGFDHSYDLPVLDAETRIEVLQAHLAEHPIPPYELLVTTRIP
jgi:hypothetical protein